MALSDYLAKNYLSADKPSKKRKRKHAAESGLIIADDNDDFGKSSKSRPRLADDNDDGPLIVDGRVVELKTTSWKTIGAAAPSNAEQEAADAILASAEEERSKRIRADEEGDGPTVVPSLAADDGTLPDAPSAIAGGPGAATMASGALAGLQTAAQVTAALKRKERLEKERMIAEGLDGEAGGKATETIYRDASGRVINVAMKRAELRRKAEEEAAQKREDDEGRTGDVQRRDREKRRRQLEDVALQGVARYADDEGLNRELKERERWNDPMAQILDDAGVGAGRNKAGKGGRCKMYEGGSEPNRYGIKPGYRWDGVDRSNGFERKWFAARNKVQSRKDLEYAWEMDE